MNKSYFTLKLSLSLFTILFLLGITLNPINIIAQADSFGNDIVPELSDDFEDPNWEYDYDAKRSTNGRWFLTTSKGVLRKAETVDAPDGARSGSSRGLLLQSRFVSGDNQAQSDLTSGRHLDRLGRQLTKEETPMIIYRVYLPTLNLGQNTIGFRLDARRAPGDGSSNNNGAYYPSIFIQNRGTVNVGIRDGLSFFHGDRNAKSLGKTGWHTFAIGFDEDGVGHYYHKEGAGDITAADEFYQTSNWGAQASKMNEISGHFITIAYAQNGVSTPEFIVDDIEVRARSTDDDPTTDDTACPEAGTLCDDGNANTTGDVEDGDCNCVGTACPTEGTACDDGSARTFDDREDGNCNCIGTACPTLGTACDDGDPNTIDDKEDGRCNCKGRPKPADSEDINCDDMTITQRDNSIIVGGLDKAPNPVLIIFKGWRPIFFCFSGDCNAEEEITDLEDGRYTVIYRYHNDKWRRVCAKRENIYIGTQAGSRNNDNYAALDSKQVAVYPNPASHQVSIDIPSIAGVPTTIEIYNNLGKRMEQLDFDAFPPQAIQIDLSRYDSGLYYIVTKAKGQLPVTKKLTVSKL